MIVSRARAARQMQFRIRRGRADADVSRRYLLRIGFVFVARRANTGVRRSGGELDGDGRARHVCDGARSAALQLLVENDLVLL